MLLELSYGAAEQLSLFKTTHEQDRKKSVALLPNSSTLDYFQEMVTVVGPFF
jgi:hypothetical protein